MSISQLLLLAAGTFIKDYEIIELLGSGGFGAVYKAKPQNGSSVAIKETYYNDEQELKMFQNEAKLLSSLSDEGFPKVIDHFGDGISRYFLIMELIEGDDLAEVLKKEGKPIELNKVLDWANEILLSLEHLHSKPIIHRDIKLQNIKLTPRGRIKIIDLGIAKGYFNEGSKVEIVLSSPAFSKFYSPIEQSLHSEEDIALMMKSRYGQKCEQVLAQGTDTRADVYSLGITLYRLLTNTAPINSLVRADLVWSGKNDLLIPAHEVNKKIPIEISQVLSKAIKIERHNRFGTAAQMRAALNQAVAKVRNRYEQQQLAELAERESLLREKEKHQININKVHIKKSSVDWEQIKKINLFFNIPILVITLVPIVFIAFEIKPFTKNQFWLLPVLLIIAFCLAMTVLTVEIRQFLLWFYLTNGRLLAKNGNYGKAIKRYNIVIWLDSTNVRAYFNRAIAHKKSGLYDNAIEDYDKVIELDPYYVTAYNNRGVFYREQGDFDRAIKNYDKAIKLKPDYVLAYNNRGNTYAKIKNYDLAITDYRKVLEINPNHKPAKNNLGRLLKKTGNR